MAKMILGFAGEMASGKGTATKYVLKKHGGEAHRFSTMLRDILNRMYLEKTRENLACLSTILRKNFGEDVLARVMAEDVRRDKNEYVVVDGVRRMADIKYLKEFPNFKLIYIDTNIQTAYGRIIRRGENDDDLGKTFSEFKKEHELESEAQIRGLKQHADYLVDNNGTLDDMYAQIDKILSKV